MGAKGDPSSRGSWELAGPYNWRARGGGVESDGVLARANAEHVEHAEHAERVEHEHSPDSSTEVKRILTRSGFASISSHVPGCTMTARHPSRGQYSFRVLTLFSDPSWRSVWSRSLYCLAGGGGAALWRCRAARMSAWEYPSIVSVDIGE